MGLQGWRCVATCLSCLDLPLSNDTDLHLDSMPIMLLKTSDVVGYLTGKPCYM